MKGWSAEKLVMLVTRCVSKLRKAKLTTLATNVKKLRNVNVDGIWVQDPRRGKTIRYVSTVRIGQIYTVCKYSTCVSAVRAV